MQLSRGRQAVPGADEAYTYGLWHGTLDDSRPRRGVADAFDADEALMGARSRASGGYSYSYTLRLAARSYASECGGLGD